MWIYLTRHAETNANVERIVQTPDTVLSANGVDQAQQLANAYCHLPISNIISSDYTRTHATASKLHEALNDQLLQSDLSFDESTLGETTLSQSRLSQTTLGQTTLGQTTLSELTLSRLLRERNFGDLRGKAYNDIPHDIFAADFHPPLGESYADFVTRVREAWRFVTTFASEREGDLLIMTHGLVVRCILSEVLMLPPEVLAKTDIQNTSVTKISKSDHSHIALLCDTSHLLDEMLVKP